jgi:hypothetical protein
MLSTVSPARTPAHKHSHYNCAVFAVLAGTPCWFSHAWVSLTVFAACRRPKLEAAAEQQQQQQQPDDKQQQQQREGDGSPAR